MELNQLTAISPIDGRYRSKCAALDEYFSEFGLIRYRVKVEIEYFIALAELPLPALASIDTDTLNGLRDIYRNFSVADAQQIKDIDTSQDINNTAVPMSIADAIAKVYRPAVVELRDRLAALAAEWADVAMLARTHGQPASPTRLGKEIQVYVYRLTEQLASLDAVKISGKFGGATGNFNAHHAAFPAIDWAKFGAEFLSKRLGIEREAFTTQISNYDNLAALFDAMRRINTVVLDLDRDMWMYISMNYFKQQIKAGEVGSSAMPHKVNPIDYENSEGNIGIANALYAHLAQKLPVSRLQRDLTDSTVLRNVGIPMAHSLIAFASTLKGLGKVLLNRAAIDADLADTWAVVAEGIQTILRREGYPHPYETLKQLTRTNSVVTAQSISEFIDTLDVSDQVRAELHALSPSTYTGI